MNRQQRRKELREGKKTTDRLKSWLSGLNPEQKRLFSLTVGQEVDRISKDTELVIDSCYATAIDDNLDIGVNDIKKIVIEANAYMEEVKEYLTKNREGYFMKIDDYKLIENIKKDIADLMKEGVVKSKSLTQLKNKYKLPANVLNDLWLQVKEELGKGRNPHTPVKKAESKKHISKEVLEEIKKDLKEEPEKEKFLQQIGKEIDNKLNEVAVDQELPYVVTEKELEEGKFIDVKDVIEELGATDAKFKAPATIKKVSEIFQGKYDTYTRSTEGVRTTQRLFKDIKDLEQYKSGVEAEFKSKKDLIKEEMEKWNEKLKEVQEEENKEVNFIYEVKEVFNA